MHLSLLLEATHTEDDDNWDAVETDEESAKRLAALEAENHAVLTGLWEEFDRDQSGTLDLAECKALIAAYLNAASKFLPKIIDENADARVELLVSMAPEDQRAERRKVVVKQVKQVTQRNKQRIDRLVSGLVSDVDTTASRVLAIIDADQSGQVDRMEFLNRFLDACSTLVPTDLLEVE